MILKAEASCFRNYDHVDLKLQPHINFFVGDNGQGKTAFLEILFAGLRGKSFRPFSGDQFIQNNKEESFIRLSLQNEGNFFIDVSFKKNEGRLLREVFVNKKRKSFSYLKKEVPVLVFKAEDMSVIKGPSKERRSFIDSFLVFNKKEETVYFFKKALQEKTTLLRDYKKGNTPLKETTKMLEALNDVFFIQASKLLKERFLYLQSVEMSLEEISPLLFFKNTKLGFKYFSSSKEVSNVEEACFEMQKAINKQQGLELKTGLPLVGPQKDEILFLFDKKDSRTQCSQGQQRAFILSVLLNESFRSKEALLFLDDVLSELDEETQKKALFFIEKRDRQTFITTCKKMSFKPKKSWFFKVKNGTINPCNYDRRTTTNKTTL